MVEFMEFGFMLSSMELTVETFRHEIASAMKTYDKFVVCLDKTPDECVTSIESLVEKAVRAYANRGANLRHGIALDRQITIILSQTENERPLCGIYFNLSSPYQKKPSARKTVEGGAQTVEGGAPG